MSRRRRKNPFLARAILISIGVNIIVLPILAYYGAFRKIAGQFGTANVVLVTTPEVKKETNRAKADKKPDDKRSTSNKGPKLAHHGVAKPNPNAPKVLTQGDGAGADADGPSAVSGTGKAGVVPNAPGSASAVAPASKPKPTTESAPASQPSPTPTPQPQPKAVVKRTPVFAAPTIADGPEPTIPDDLRDEAFDKTFIAEFTVGPDGNPVNVRTAESTGIDELDRIALEAARRWRFHPATLDGVGVESRVRLQVEFKVE
jgi:protein TonB